jgi:hypothetical protein
MSLNVVYKVELDATDSIKINKRTFSDCIINNAVNNGWSVKEKTESTRFQKK